jgi:radical SAM-linked protein
MKYSRGEEFLYVGNLDIHKIWERSFRRADLRLAYSQGFHPQPRIQQACPLPLGFTSSDEVLDFWLDSSESLMEIQQKIENVIQPGIKLLKLENIPLNSPPLQTIVNAARYQIFFEEPVDKIRLQENIRALLTRVDCKRERRGKTYDLLPLIIDIKIIENPTLLLELILATLPSATGRPEEVLDELSVPLSSVLIHRCELIFGVTK